jgi:hypothetical protein
MTCDSRLASLYLTHIITRETLVATTSWSCIGGGFCSDLVSKVRMPFTVINHRERRWICGGSDGYVPSGRYVEYVWSQLWTLRVP